MGIQAATSQLEVFFDTTTRKTRAHAEIIQRNLTSDREYPAGRTEHDGDELWDELWDGSHSKKYDEGGWQSGPRVHS